MTTKTHNIIKRVNKRRAINRAPIKGFMRLDAILEIIPIGRSTWWAGVKEGRFPKGTKLSNNVTAWKTEDIIKLIENNGCIHGYDCDLIQ